MKITITGPRSVGKTTISKLVAKKLKLNYVSSDEIGEKITKKFGGLHKAIKSGEIKEALRKNGYSLLEKEYKKENFVFDLSIGSFTSTDFKSASKRLRSIAKRKSLVIGLLPFRQNYKSISLLFNREAKRKHFIDSDKQALLKRTKKRYTQQKEIILKNCHLVIFMGDKTKNEVVKVILMELDSLKNV